MNNDVTSNTLPRKERLRGRRSVSQLFAEGRSGFSFPLRYVWRVEATESDEESGAEVLFNVPKRFHKRANKRNLLRRRVKEAYRLNKELVKGEINGVRLHIALIYTTKEVLEYARIERGVQKALAGIAQELRETEKV